MVGAPHFFERRDEIGGAAYVYINPGGRWDSATPLRLNGTRGSMFGIALSTAGDLNHDGFEGEGLGGLREGSSWAGTQPMSCRGREIVAPGGCILWRVLGGGVDPPTHLVLPPPQTWQWGLPSTVPAKSTSTTAAAWALW